jgi:hypothetical protein
MRTVAVLIAVALGAFALGRITAPSDAPATRERVVERAVAVPTGGGACVARLDDDDLRRLRDLVDATRPAPSPEPTADPAPAPSPAQVTAAREGASVLDAALAAGRWTDDDAAALRTQLAAMDPAASAETLRRMAVEVDAGRLRVETTGSPF